MASDATATRATASDAATRAMTPAALGALMLGAMALVALSGCCARPEVGGALVVNNTDAPVTVTVVEEPEGYGPWTVEPGKDETAVASPGTRTLRLSGPQGVIRELKIELPLDGLRLVTVSPDTCMALADHTAQYGGDGHVEVQATAGPERPGTIDYLQGTYLGPGDKLPADLLEGQRAARFTNVPCALLDDPQALADHLYKLD